MLVGLALLTAAALVAFGCHWLVAGGGLVLVLRALQLPLVGPIVAERNPGQQRVRALAANAVWRDIGAGIGPMLAAVVLPLMAPVWVYALAALALAISALACARRPAVRLPMVQPPAADQQVAGGEVR